MASDWVQEFRRKIRTVRAGVYVVRHSRDLLAPSMGWGAYVLWGRKVARWISAWLVPLALIACALAPGSLVNRTILVLQSGFYALAVAGMIRGHRADDSRFLSLPRAFLAVNAAAIIGSWQALTGGSNEIWTPDRGAD